MHFLPLRTSEFYPLTLSMPVENMLFGNFSLKARWESVINRKSIKYHLWVEPTVLPDTELTAAIHTLSPNQLLVKDKRLLAAHLDVNYHRQFNSSLNEMHLNNLDVVSYPHSIVCIDSLQYMIDQNKNQIVDDWEKDGNIKNWECPSNFKNTFIAPGVELHNVHINDQQGPVIIHKGVTILPGAKMMGPLVIRPGTVVKMGAELYSGSSFGDNTTVNGEIKNCIFHEYTAKGHAGYVGDSILGRWNNFGAGTTVSNVSNTFSRVRVKDWNTGIIHEYESIKRGVITGDFVKLGIQSQIYRGTSIGSFSSITKSGSIAGNIPPFTWWSEEKPKPYNIQKLTLHCQRQMALKNEVWGKYWQNTLEKMSETYEHL